jgi:hypothetical protein
VEAQTWRMDLQNKIQGTRLLFMRTPVVLRKPIIAWSLTTPFTSHISWIYNILLVLSFFFCVWTARISGQDQRKPNTAQDPDPSVLMSPGDYERFLPFLFMDVRSKACVRERERERWGKPSLYHSRATCRELQNLERGNENCLGEWKEQNVPCNLRVLYCCSWDLGFVLNTMFRD